MLFAAEFLSGFGVMVLDISIGSIFAAVIPDALRSGSAARSRRSTTGRGRSARCSAGCSVGVGLRPALWVAVSAAWPVALLLPSPLPRFRLPA